MMIKTLKKRVIFITNFVIVIFWSFFTTTAAFGQATCEVDNNALQAMPQIEVTLMRADGSSYSMPAKIANNPTSRAAGFQRVCESTIEAMPILFVFEKATIPGFHMNNVVAPIDIAFIDERGRIKSIQAMKPYNLLLAKKPLYSPKQPVLFALEVHKDFFEEHQIAVGSKMSWTTASESK